jgi:L-alanine-DL-glutamate epimerase-like enolase superfamily enzyme
MGGNAVDNTRIARIEWGTLRGRRPRAAGCNARLGAHGQDVRSPVARITTDDGATGFGWARITREEAQALVGRSLAGTVDWRNGVAEALRAIEYPLLDLAARRAGQPVYALIGGEARPDAPFCVRCYDTSLYMDDLHLADDDEAAALIAAEATEGLARGHRDFKIKVGRGAMHLSLEQGTARDIRVIQAVREVAGPEARIMIDANNGYNVNLAKRVLRETAEGGIYWIEEPFHEDARLYAHLHAWLDDEGLDTLIADGEGDASPRLVEWARDGLVDVVQYDIRRPGFSFWLDLGPRLDAWGARSAPHNYGEPYGNYLGCHLAAAIDGFQAVEWDEAPLEGLDTSGYRIVDGFVHVPDAPGFGLALDEAVYARAVADEGFVVEA